MERKLALLDEPHIAPLTQFVRRLRSQRGGGESVPWFDPDEGGVGARILLLLEAPGPRATGPGGPRPAAEGSGFISCDNNDQTAANLWALLDQAGVDRREIVTWNIVPWYVGDGTAIRPVSVADLEEARPALRELLSLLPEVRVVVLLGRKAAAGWQRAGTDLPTIEAPHPSPQAVNPRPAAWAEIRSALIEARRRAGLFGEAPPPGPRRARLATAAFPDAPGVYALYDSPDALVPLYVGVAATQSLRERWARQHLRGRAGGSALRRSIGVRLGLVSKKLRRPDRYYPPDVEAAITAFLNDAWIELHPTTTADEARALEARLITELHPVLNVARPRVATPSSPPINRSTLEETLRRLAAERPLFHSEADFQHALAWQLHLDHPAARVRLEARPLPGRPMRLDLHIVVADQRVAIELKYLTKRLAVTIDGEAFDLRDHGADDLGRYDVVKDVARLEELTDHGAADTGYALLLTNQPSYWLPGRGRATADAAFRLADGRTLEGALPWGPTAGESTRRGRDTISLRGRYELSWADYTTVTSASNGALRSLLIQVDPAAGS